MESMRVTASMVESGERDGNSSSMRTLDSRSATTFVFPGMCRTSEVNSAMNEGCRVCCGDLSVFVLNANISGLWSVHI